MNQDENRQRFESQKQSHYSDGIGDITQLFDQYKQQQTKLSPLGLAQFEYLAKNEEMPIIAQAPLDKCTKFVPFKELNLGAVAEFKRSLQQSKCVWNSYSTYLFNESSFDADPNHLDSKTSRKMQLLHNKEAFRQIRERSKQIHDQQLQEYHKVLQQLNFRQKNVRSYPSLAYQDQQRLDFLRKQQRYGGNSHEEDEEQELQKRITETNVVLNQIKKQIVYAYKDDYCYWGPSSRDGSTMVSFDRKLFLYGGAGASKWEDFCTAQIDKQFYKWQPVKLDEKPSLGYRVHHSASVYRHNMVIFGGEIHTVQSQGQRVNGECTSDIKIINLNSFDIKVLKQTGIQSPRKCHVSEVVGRSLLIHGGIDIKGVYLKDMIIFDMVNQKWSVPATENHLAHYPNGVAFHKSCAVLHNKQLDIYKSDPDIKTANQGIYFFGGQDKTGAYLDKFIRVNVYQKPISFEVVKTQGVPPIARSQHSMSYNEYLQIIAIFGGKNDDDSEEGFLNDICLMDLKTMSWIHVEIKGTSLFGRCGHTSACVETRLFIYGGYNYNGFVKSDVVVLELDNSQANQLQQQDVQSEKGNEKSSKHAPKISIHETKTERTEVRRKNMIADLSSKATQSAMSLPFLQKRQSMMHSLFRHGNDPPKVSPKGDRVSFAKALTVITEKTSKQ